MAQPIRAVHRHRDMNHLQHSAHASPWFCRHSDLSNRNRTDMRCGSMRKRAKLAIGLLAFLVSLPLFGAAWFFIGMSGGIYSIILNMKSRPTLDSPDLRRNRTKLEAQIDGDFGRAVPNEGVVHYETSLQDSCYDGTNNWKRRDGFAHRCTLRATRFFGFDGDFRKAMLDFETGLFAAGWHFNIHDMEWTLTNYYDAVTRNFHTVDYIPNPYPYYKGGLALEIRWAERDSQRLLDLKNIQAHGMGENNFYDQRKLTDAADVFRKVTQDHRYILAIAISGHYFEN